VTLWCVSCDVWRDV